jgi:integrase
MNRVKAVLSPEKVNALSARLKKAHPRFYLLWAIGISTGLRISDLLCLRPSHLTSTCFTFEESKTKKTRHLELDDELLQEARRFVARYHLGDGHFLFFSSAARKHKPMSRQWAHRVIAREAAEVALEMIGAHSMRKIYACRLFASSGSIETVQAILGHKYVSTTLIYLRDILEGKFEG